MNMTWSGDAQWAMEEAATVGVDLAYTIPEEGSNVWYDGWGKFLSMPRILGSQLFYQLPL